MPSPFDNQFTIDKKNRKAGRDPEPEVIILTHRKGFVKETGFYKKCLLHHYRGRADDTERKALFKYPTRIFCMLEHCVDSLPFPNPDLIGVANGIMGVVIQKSHLNLQFPLHPKIIRIQKGDISASGMKNPFVSGCAHPFVHRMLKQLDSSPISLHLLCRSIGGAVI